MKKTLFFLLLSLSLFTKAQIKNNGCWVELERMQVMYVGIENPLRIHDSENIDNYTLYAPNLKCIPSKEPGVFLITPRRATGRNGVAIYVLNEKKDTVQVQRIRIKRLPDATASILNQKQGYISKGKARVMTRVDAKIENFDFEVSIKVKSFNMIIIHPDSAKKITLSSVGNLLTPEMKTALMKVESRSIILFNNIKVRYPNGNARILSSILLTVK